jgi:hypothetical protein
LQGEDFLTSWAPDDRSKGEGKLGRSEIRLSNIKDGPFMGGFLRKLFEARRISGLRRSRRGGWRPEVDALENRQLLFVSQLVVTATPHILSPPNGQYVPVTVSGSLVAPSKSPATGFFHVTDQYGKIEPFGPVTLTPTATNPNLFTYSFTIHLRAERGSQTRNGRQYDILVGGTDKDNTAFKTIAVLVPKNPVHPQGPAATPAARALHVGQARRLH